VKNITVSLDDETYRKARIEAARRDTSVSALVKLFLTSLEESETDSERMKRQEKMLREQVSAFSGSNRLSRESLHERGA
jgi:hypothetical protein